MNTKTLLLTALRSLKHHKGRSLLTMLGIIIGIGSIIAIMAIGRGAEERIKQEIMAYGDNFVYIDPGNTVAVTQGKNISKKRILPFVYADVELLRNNVSFIKNASPMGYSSDKITAYGSTISTQIKSGSADLFAVLSRRLAKGQLFSPEHVYKGSRVIVLGSQAALNLFKNADPLGKSVQLKKINFTVIGILKKLETQQTFSDPNLDVFIPITTAKKCRLAPPGNQIHGIALSIKSNNVIPQATRGIKKILRARRRIEIGQPDDFTLWDQASMLKAAQASATILSLLLFIIAAISLLVGGIGVMNIMLVSVGERTQEIGIRMALGAPDKAIMRQFLLESIILCSLGGIIGVILGCGIPFVVSLATGWIVIITPISMLIATVAIVIVGLIFGYYPARKASRLDPVIALTEQ